MHGIATLIHARADVGAMIPFLHLTFTTGMDKGTNILGKVS